MKNLAQNFTSTHALFLLIGSAAAVAAYAIDKLSAMIPA